MTQYTKKYSNQSTTNLHAADSVNFLDVGKQVYSVLLRLVTLTCQ
jgi:hypothetical protein